MKIKAVYLVMERYENTGLDIDHDDIVCICDTKELAIKKAISYCNRIDDEMTNEYYSGRTPGFTYIPVNETDLEEGYYQEFFTRGKLEHRSICVKEYGVFEERN